MGNIDNRMKIKTRVHDLLWLGSFLNFSEFYPLFVSFLETGSCYVAMAGLELAK